LPLMAGVAVARCLRNIGVDAGLKWPNDVLVGGKKVCGILLEGGRDGIAAGLGINLNFSADQLPKELESSATSIQDILGQQVDRGVLLAELLECMDGLYSSFKQNDNRILEEWRSLSITLGKKVAITTPSGAIEGVAVDIDEHGGLILDLGGERVKVLAGDCVHLR
ncbi:MAG: biotin--[acetyl-CoA-carboxylase] ligase, partial [Candidatus Thermoplasmatota archaeon]|nr:biotin--[acetyl-CoA-carboxylase] ligase [Candidatus Thermoplasmatota archaeon]